MKIAIIGAGHGGMAAAYDLNKAGHQVSIFEASDHVGGLAFGFKEPEWDWSVEMFYHHWFQSDKDILGLMKELGLRDQVIFPQPKTVVYYQEKFYALDSPQAALTFPGFSFLDMVRFGLVTVYLRYISSWKGLEKVTADSWMRKYYGENLYKTSFEPLLTGKFGDHYREVNMAWFWARLKTRTTRLGTFKGGFQAFSDRFADILRQSGVDIILNSPVQKIAAKQDGKLALSIQGEEQTFERVLVTNSPGALAKMVPSLPQDYLNGLLNLKNMGAVVLILSLKHQLSKEGYYWYNLPKTAGYPFLALVEHTNYVSPQYFHGEHILYCGDYLDPSHEYFSLTKEQLVERFLPSLKRINPDFNPDWLNRSWLYKTDYAQPIPLVNHSQNIPAIQTPIPGLYFASMSQVYPWDRGTNFAVQIGRQAAHLIISEG